MAMHKVYRKVVNMVAHSRDTLTFTYLPLSSYRRCSNFLFGIVDQLNSPTAIKQELYNANRYSQQDIHELNDQELVKIMAVTHSTSWTSRSFKPLTLRKWFQINVEDECCRRLHNMDKQLWLNLVHISSSPHVPIRSRFTKALAKRTERELDSIDDLSTMTKLFQLFAERGSKFQFLNKLEQRLARNIKDINLQDIIPLYHGVAKNKTKHKPLLSALIDHACRNLNHLDDISIRNLVLMLTKCRVFNMELIFDIAAISILKLSNWSPYTVGVIAWAFAKHLIYNRELFEAVGQHFMNNHQQYGQYDVAQVLYSFAKVNFKPSNSKEFFSAIENLLNRSYDNYNPKFLLNIAWSMAILQRYHRPLFAKVFDPTFLQKCQSNSGLSRVDKVQLCQIDLAVKLEYGDGSSEFSLPLPLRNQIIKTLANLQRITSTIEIEVQQAMERIFGGKQYFGSEISLECGYSLDMAFVLDDRNRALLWRDFDSIRLNEDIFAVLDTKR
ncbi:uncharacterized protein TRIADDRAFT_53221 [Trichoplax adhaerens]|uniref:FAST kinase leucine-rich domain-containing protein n=1 Tax=Trichoplax adhaerens TaxID=10228 RepID=B3RNM7_TRIAD|nr:hypothetical protein TRIADDRAFT_53221 [Trichoplax adhaerens]EDV28045.1 hypothetical protein TRIADDRAFT_53221 [Trichoplax adhaerens]|eukprot:XP_002109879.1 hypothetical protein TRIADDRAFT_53221 [Trichoplax adhaerens]